MKGLVHSNTDRCTKKGCVCRHSVILSHSMRKHYQPVVGRFAEMLLTRSYNAFTSLICFLCVEQNKMRRKKKTKR